MTTEANLGQALSTLRRRNNWTLHQVSQKTGLSISTLSRVERDQLSLTYGKLVQLGHGLGVDLATLFDGAADQSSSDAPVGQRSVNRFDDGRVVATSAYRHVYLSTDLMEKKFMPMFIEPRARSLEEFGGLVRHAGHEFSVVMEGTVAVHTEGYAPVILKAGESIYFNSRMGHAYIAHGKGRCRVLSVCSAPAADVEEVMEQHVSAHSSRGNGAAALLTVKARKRRV